jgi:hypothetical protein
MSEDQASKEQQSAEQAEQQQAEQAEQQQGSATREAIERETQLPYGVQPLKEGEEPKPLDEQEGEAEQQDSTSKEGA